MRRVRNESQAPRSPEIPVSGSILGHPESGEIEVAPDGEAEPQAPEILRLIAQYMAVLTVERASSEHTVRAYQRELQSFAAFLAKRCGEGVVPSQIEHPVIREYLGTLYEKNLSKPSVARALAAIRSWFGWLARTGHIEQNPARLVSTPKLPKHLPRVPGAEQLNQAFNDVDTETAWPERDRVIMELLYGCGIRNAELVGLNLEDIQWGNECLLVRGKGRKERYVPLGDAAAMAVRTYLPQRAQKLLDAKRASEALLLNVRLRGDGRLTTRSVGRIVKRVWRCRMGWRRMFIHTRCGMRLGRTCWRRERICAPSRRFLAMRGFRRRSGIRI